MPIEGVGRGAIALVALGAALVGCVVVPPRDGLARVRVGDVVKRIKCDLAETIFNKAYEKTPDGRTPFVFLANWAAKIHLTIAVDDTVSFSPGATVTHPLDKTVATTLIPATVETFSLGVGAGISTEAVRQEDVEFLVSFSDMIKEFNDPLRRELLYNNCSFENGLLLESDLGLGPLVNSALEPVENGILKQGPGNVGPPGTSAVAIPASQLNDISNQLNALKTAAAGLPKPSSEQTLTELGNTLKDKSQFNALINKLQIPNSTLSKPESQIQAEGQSTDNVQTVKKVVANSDLATTEETRTQSIINDIVKPLYAIASTSLDPSCFAPVTKSQFEAITWSAQVSVNVIKVDTATDQNESDNALKAVRAAKDKVIDATTKMINQIKECKPPPKKSPPGPPQYDPIDLMSETVNFYITTSGSVTPTWKLVKVTAPLAPTLLSGNRKDTNTLILAMGRPSVAANGTVTSSSAMDYQVLSSILSQAVRPPTIVP
jgi:hypothetical protein